MSGEDPTTERAAERMPASQRREQLLTAAASVFGERGYAATTTDQVAQAAGISQPYVVRMFGGKKKLFIAVLERALERMLAAFRTVLADWDGQDRAALRSALGASYVDLIEDRGLLLSLMQGFLMGHDDEIGARARAGFVELYSVLRTEGGFDAQEADDFIAAGMLLNTLVALWMPQEYHRDDTARELLDAALQGKVEVVLRAAASQTPPVS